MTDPLSPFHLSPEFPLHTLSALDLGSGGRLSWKRFHHHPLATATGVP